MFKKFLDALYAALIHQAANQITDRNDRCEQKSTPKVDRKNQNSNKNTKQYDQYLPFMSAEKIPQILVQRTPPFLSICAGLGVDRGGSY